MKKLYIVSGSENGCYSISSDHGIPSSKICPIYNDELLSNISDGFAIITSGTTPEEVHMSQLAQQSSLSFIFNSDASKFISEFNDLLNRAMERAAKNLISINNAKNLIMDSLLNWMPNGKFDFAISINSGKLIIYSNNEWTAGMMTLYGAH